MKWSYVFPTSPGIGVRVLVKLTDGSIQWAMRNRNTPCEGSHWIGDDGTIVRNVVGWTFVVAGSETE